MKIRFEVRGKKDPSPIYIRFSVSRDVNLRRSTGIQISPRFFNSETSKLKRVSEFKDYDNILLKLQELKTFIIEAHNKADLNKIDSNWLEHQINLCNGKALENEIKYLDQYAEIYLNNLPNRRSHKGERGVSISTLQKYKTILIKIKNFQAHIKQRVLLTDVNLKLRNKLLNYFEDEEKLSTNTAGRYIKFVKTICLDAKAEGYKVSDQLSKFKGFSEKIEKIHLSFDELEMIEQVTFKKDELECAKDFLIIGCYIGQRAGDILSLSSSNVYEVGELEFIELIQEKTGKKVMILIHPKVREILDKRGGNFPKVFAKTRASRVTMFNRYIKEVCKEAGLNKVIQGSKINPTTNRKEKGTYQKWELVTSHICRRSFCTNYYGHVPTPFLMEISGHSREEEFLNYIAKKPIDYAKQMLKYWKVAIEEQQRKTKLKAI